MHFSTADYEMVFHEITRMPTPEHDDKQVLKKKHVGNDARVFDMLVHFLVRCLFADTFEMLSLIVGLACGLQTIVWNEHKSNFNLETITSHCNHAHFLVIAPQASGLFSSELWGLPIQIQK